MMDELRLRGIEVTCIIGDLPEERLHEQRLEVDVALGMDLRHAAETDDLHETVDYAALTQMIRETLKRAKCRLVERAAEEVAQVCLADMRVKRVRVCVTKRGTVPFLGAAEVTVERMR